MSRAGAGVMTGAKTMDFMQPTADRIAKLVPLGERKTLAGQEHHADAEAVAPLLIELFSRPSGQRGAGQDMSEFVDASE